MKWLCVLFVFVPACSMNEFSEPQNVTGGPCTDSNHLFLTPGVLTAGGINRACLSRFEPDGPARMMVTLVADDVQAATASRELPPGDGGCVDISVPQKPNTKAKLVVNLRYPEAKCSWERSVSVLISAGRVVVVHTERARYRAGETLRARIIALKPDLTPAHGLIDEVWVEGPRGAWEGSRAVQWLRVRSRMGIAQVQHDLDELAPAGRWTIRAKMEDGSQGSSVFWVGSYELPPFQLSVRHAPRVLRTSERLVWTVCVRYPWTEAVEGMLVIRIRGAGGTTVANEANSSIKTVVRIKAPRACHRHAAAARRIGLNGTNPPDVVIADFSFQEDGTRIWQNTTVVSQVVDQAVTLEFLRKVRAVISPGLPYKLKVKATRWDDKPAANEVVRVCHGRSDFAANLPPAARQAMDNDSCHDVVTDDRGIARVTFTTNDDGRSYYSFEASLKNDSNISAAPLNLPARHAGAVHASLGPIKPSPNSARTFVPLYINLRNVSRPLTVHFVVITRGGIIYRWGATTQCPLTSSSDYIPTTSRNSQCYYSHDTNMANYQTNAANNQANSQMFVATQENASKNETNDPDSLLDRHLLRVMLPIKVTHQMCPDSHLVAYFYYNGELVSASKQFEMDECFSNKVEATWLSRQAAPGSIASFRVSTPGPALCALSVLDSSSKLSQPAPTLKELVMKDLKRLMDSHRNLTEYEAAGACFKTSDVPELPTNSRELTATWLAAAGVRVTGGYITSSQRCTSPPSPLMDEVTVPRSDFSEAWLWRLAAVGTNGSSVVSAQTPDSISRFEATAVCLARTGIAVSPPAVLQVFREFFIHADGPRRLRRGDAAIIRYRLFNYLYEPLSVQIQILTDAHIEGPVELVESACIDARASVARRVEILAKVPGSARLSIRAKSVHTPDCANTTQPRRPVSDEVIFTITVDPEGVPVQEHKSILLCGRGSPESSRSEVSWSWPPIKPVPGTETLTVWATGDVKGPLLFAADGLVTLPRGCGEQNMARLASNLLSLQQLDSASPAAAIAKEHVARGFTRQLQYIHGAGGFSAFGASDNSPSTWLTAFALKYLRRAHKVLNPELPVPPALERAERWLLNQQMENGCFRNEGQVFHRELRGGLNEEGEVASVALTAYVITALVDSTAPLPSRVLYNTVSCLRALPPMKTRSLTHVYAHALLGYAFMRIRSYEDELRKTNEASLLWDKKEAIGAGLKEDEELRELMELLKLARRSGDYVWWETSSLATSVEATAYALLALSYCPAPLRGTSCAGDARAAIRWLSVHRNHAGGFLSTQDTLVALEALSSWSSVQPSAPPNLTVKLQSGSELKKIQIQPEVKVPDVTRIAGKSQVDVSVEGTGCALIQATRSYNTLAPDQSQDKLLTVQATVHTDGAFDCDVNGTNCFCAAVVELCVSWSGVFPAMAVAELVLPAAFGADATRLYALLHEPDTLLRRIELTPNGGRATLYLASRDGMESSHQGHRCFPVHAVGPKARTKPAHVRVFDYYTPTLNDTQMYTIPEDCPPRISHSTNDYLPSDNLFNKAKSLTDSEEILITHEFSFEDIPEGIPLDDPLFDLGREDISYLTKYNKVQPTESDILAQEGNLAEDYNDSYKDSNGANIAQPRRDSNNEIPPPIISDRKKNGDVRKEIRGSKRSGHSIPFFTDASRNFNIDNFRVNNYNRRQNSDQHFHTQHFIPVDKVYSDRQLANFRVNGYENVYFTQNPGQSYLYPEHVIYHDINPYFQRADKHNYFNKQYQETLARLYDESNFNRNKYSISKVKSNGNEQNEQQNAERLINNIDLRHGINSGHSINGQNGHSVPIENVKHDDLLANIDYKQTKVKEKYNPTEMFSTSKPVGFKNVEQDKIIQPSYNTTDYSENIKALEPHAQINNPKINTTQSPLPDNAVFNPIFNPTVADLTDLDIPQNREPQKNTPQPLNPESSNIDSYLSNFGPNATPVHLTSPVIPHYKIPEIITQPTNPPELSNTDPNLAPLSNTHSAVTVISHSDVPSGSPEVFNPSVNTGLESSSFDTEPNYEPNLSIPHLEGSLESPKEPEKFAQSDNAAVFAPHSQIANPGSFLDPSLQFGSSSSDIHIPISVPPINQQQDSGVLDHPNFSDFHLIDSETDLEVPSGLEGPVPAVALPPPNFVAVAPPPGFQPPYLYGYPRLYPPPPRPQYYYRQVPVPAG